MTGVLDPGQATHPRNLLVGRAVERAIIDELLRDAERGVAGAVLARRPPWHRQVRARRLRGRRRIRLPGRPRRRRRIRDGLRVRGVHQLVLPLLDCVEALPEPQRAALEAVLGTVAARRARPVPRRSRRAEPGRGGRPRPARARRHRRRAVGRRRVGDGAVVRGPPPSRRTGRVACHHARHTGRPGPLRRHPPDRRSAGCPRSEAHRAADRRPRRDRSTRPSPTTSSPRPEATHWRSSSCPPC